MQAATSQCSVPDSDSSSRRARTVFLQLHTPPVKMCPGKHDAMIEEERRTGVHVIVVHFRVGDYDLHAGCDAGYDDTAYRRIYGARMRAASCLPERDQHKGRLFLALCVMSPSETLEPLWGTA